MHRWSPWVAAGSSSPAHSLSTTVTCLSNCARKWPAACPLLLFLPLPFPATPPHVTADGNSSSWHLGEGAENPLHTPSLPAQGGCMGAEPDPEALRG